MQGAQLLLVHAADLVQPLPQPLHVGTRDEIAGMNDVIVALAADGQDAVPHFDQGRLGGAVRHLFGRVADHVLHLLDEHGEHAAQRLSVGVVEGELVLDRLADPAQHGFGDVAAIGEDDPLLPQDRADVKQLAREHGYLLPQAAQNPTP